MVKGKLKAYIVNDKWNDAGSIITWAETSGKAKALALYDDIFSNCEYTELRAERSKYFDKYADSKKIPIRELLDRTWWFGCCKCNKEQLDQDSIDNGEAFIDETEDACEFVKGAVICAECKKKIEERGHD